MPMDRMAIVTEVLGDLGTVVRRAHAQTLDQDSFIALANKMRRDLKALRIDLTKDEMPDGQALTELGASIGELLNTGELVTGSALLDGVPDRCRTYGRFIVVDGGHGLDFSTPKGA